MQLQNKHKTDKFVLKSISIVSFFSSTHGIGLIWSIVTRGTGYETLQVSKALTKVLQFMLKVLRECTIFCFTFAHYGRIT